MNLAGTMQIKWGAHAPGPRAVLRALAEHIRASLWANRLVSLKIVNRRAGAPVGTREGACAPRKGLNRSGLGRKTERRFTRPDMHDFRGDVQEPE